MHPVLEETFARRCPQIGIGSPIVGWGLSHCQVHSDGGSLVTFPRSESDVMCFDATSQHANLAPRCWWEMRDFVGCAFRFCRCVGHFMVFGTVGQLHSPRRRLSSKASSSPMCRRSIASLSSTGRNICAVVPHTGARNSRNRVRMSSSGEELSRYSTDDPRGGRAVQKLGWCYRA